MLLNLVTPLHESTKRDYQVRILDNKVEAMTEARKFEENYWDGPRRYGYGGYAYDGRWESVARGLVDRYDLKAGDNVLDIGCGKGYLLYELQKLQPKLTLIGIDRSAHAIANPHPEFKGVLLRRQIQHGLPNFRDETFALVLSLGTLHNLTLSELWRTLPEIQRVGKRGYIMVESFRSEAEWFNLVAWCLTAETLMRPEDWQFLFDKTGYTGDHEFVYFA